jgi:hypothetical protein
MSKNKIIITSVIMAILVVAVTGCYKTTTLLVAAPEVTTEVSFSKDLVPLLAANCAKSGCHSGSITPNLSAEIAFTSLIGGKYVDVATPENSEVYLWLTGKNTPAMPLGAPSNPSNINGILLAWVKQGAKNN